MRFSEQFGLRRGQAELDFVDIPLNTDIRVFIDPWALTTAHTPWSDDAHQLARLFFQRVLDRLRAGDRAGARQLLTHLKEDNRTRLGYSARNPQGTGLGDDRAGPFLDALADSVAFTSGQIEDIEDTALFVEGIGFDIVSDMLTNVLREKLAQYTQDQCRLWGITTPKAENLRVWRDGVGWTLVTMNLPVRGRETLLLVPRSIVRKDLSLQAQQYLTDFIDNYVDPGNRPAIAALEKMLQGERKTKKSGKTQRGETRSDLAKKGLKPTMAKITKEFPEALTGYKSRAREKRPILTAAELEGIHPHQRDAGRSGIIAEMRNAANNADDAMAFVRRVVGGFIAAFHPIFQHPRLLDMSATGFEGVAMYNTAEKGELWSARTNRGRGPRPNILLLISNSTVTADKLSGIDRSAVATSTSSGVVVFVAPKFDQSVLARRKDMAKDRVLLVSASELADIVEGAADAEHAADFLEALMAA